MAMVCGQPATTYWSWRPGCLDVERLPRLEERGVVGEDVDVVERVELVGGHREIRRDLEGLAGERGVAAGVELAGGAAVDLARAEQEDLEVVRGDDGVGDEVGRVGLAGAGVVLEDRGRAPARRAGALETTMAYCCAAAFSVALIIALSRSAPQYSQPMLLCSRRRLEAEVDARAPAARLARWSGSQVCRVSLALPSTRHCCASWPSQRELLGHAGRALEEAGRADLALRRAVLAVGPHQDPIGTGGAALDVAQRAALRAGAALRHRWRGDGRRRGRRRAVPPRARIEAAGERDEPQQRERPGARGN